MSGMGKVVKLEPTREGDGSQGQEARARRVAARGVGRPGAVDRPAPAPRRDKTALVLGGGGFTGGVYEIGALRALDLLAVNSTVNQFDVYVGTSAGSFIAALCANGVTPEEMMRVVTRQGKAPFKDIDLGDLLRPNLLEFARKGAMLPLRALGAGAQVARQRAAASRRWTSLLGPRRGAALGPVHGRGHRDVPARGARASRAAPTTSASCDCELYLTATDLDTCERVVFGVDGLRRRADLHGGTRVGGAADGLRAGRGRRARADRRRHRLDHEPRHRGGGGRRS